MRDYDMAFQCLQRCKGNAVSLPSPDCPLPPVGGGDLNTYHRVNQKEEVERMIVRSSCDDIEKVPPPFLLCALLLPFLILSCFLSFPPSPLLILTGIKYD